jgi:glycosyltransferase involved in cell wall biosynthesis
MKIAFIGQKGIPAISGGVERHVEELAVRLVARGHEVIVYTRPHYTDLNLKNFKGVQLISLPSIATKNFDAITHTLLACFDLVRRQVDIIHFHSIGPSSLIWLVRLLKPRAKIIATFHSKDYCQDKWSSFAKIYLKLGEWMACHVAHKTIAISKSLTNLAKAKYGREVIYIPNGVSFAYSVEADKINQWGLTKNGYILSVARLIPNKGIHYLIQAYKNLKIDKKLVIVGGSSFTEEYESELKELAKDNKNIIFTGSQEGQTLAELYSNAYLFVQPSELEGLSIALLEAMSYGKPVLVSDISENVEAAGSAGYVFRTKDALDLSQKIIDCMSNEPLMISRGEAGRLRVSQEYGWDTIISATENVYQEALIASIPARLNRLSFASRFWTLF